VSPAAHAILFVLAQIVVGILGYRQGRQDEELRWRKHLDKLDEAAKRGRQ
jgi:hypothetical protein